MFVVAVILRVGWVAVRFGGGERAAVLTYPDEEAYWLAATSLASGEGLVDEFGYRATYMPAYPAFLAGFAWLSHGLLWARLAQAILGALVAPATFLLAEGWQAAVRSRKRRAIVRSRERHEPHTIVPALAGLAAACDPFLVFFSGLLLTETLFAVVLVGAWWMLVGSCGGAHPDAPGGGRPGVGRGVALGALVCLAIMLRPAASLLLVIVPLALAVGRRFDRATWVVAGVAVAVSLAGLLPWAVRNQVTVGAWVWTTTRGGISLYDGVHQGATGGSDLAHTKALPAVAGLSEIAWDAYFRQEAWSAIRAEPGRVTRLAVHKLRRTWSLTPNVEEYRHGAAAWVGAVWTGGVLVLAACGWWWSRRAVRVWLLLLLPVVAFTLLHMIFVGSVRYRVPVMPMVEVLAAAGLGGFFCRRAKPQTAVKSSGTP